MCPGSAAWPEVSNRRSRTGRGPRAVVGGLWVTRGGYGIWGGASGIPDALPLPNPRSRSSPPELSLPTRPRSCVTFPSPLPPPQEQRWGGRGREGVVTLMCWARVTTRWWALTPGAVWCSRLAGGWLSGSGRRCARCAASPPSFPGPAGTAELVRGQGTGGRVPGGRRGPGRLLPGRTMAGDDARLPPAGLRAGAGQGGALPGCLCRISPSRWLLSSSSRCLGSPLSWVRLGESTGVTGSTPSGL